MKQPPTQGKERCAQKRWCPGAKRRRPMGRWMAQQDTEEKRSGSWRLANWGWRQAPSARRALPRGPAWVQTSGNKVRSFPMTGIQVELTTKKQLHISPSGLHKNARQESIPPTLILVQPCSPPSKPCPLHQASLNISPVHTDWGECLIPA